MTIAPTRCQHRLAVGEHRVFGALDVELEQIDPVVGLAGKTSRRRRLGTSTAVPATAPASVSIIPESLPSARNVTRPFAVQSAACTASTSAAPFAARLAVIIANSAGSAS